MLRPDIDVRRARRRLAVCFLVLLLLGSNALPALAQGGPRLSSATSAQPLGLRRAWFSQVRLDAARNRVERATLVGDGLTVLTTGGIVQELDALTGATQWVAPIGNPKYTSLGPAASDKYVALLNGSTLYVLDRLDGKPIKVRPVGGAPGAAPALAPDYVFVPLVIGRIEAYPISKTTLTPWYYQSFGRAMVAPLATEESVVWTTDRGNMYVGRSKELGVRYRLETGSEIAASPAYQKPYIFVANIAGEVFAINELTGRRLWKYATGFPVMRAPAAVGECVYVTSDEPVLHCIEVSRGATRWEAHGVAQFAAASQRRVYGIDTLGRLVVLDATTGKRLGEMPVDGSTTALVNDQTDRIYLVSSDGLVQCLHEIGASEPLYHVPRQADQPVAIAPDAEAATTPAEPELPAMPEDEDDAMPAEMPQAPIDEDDPFNF